jgi:hypothetical protein
MGVLLTPLAVGALCLSTVRITHYGATVDIGRWSMATILWAAGGFALWVRQVLPHRKMIGVWKSLTLCAALVANAVLVVTGYLFGTPMFSSSLQRIRLEGISFGIIALAIYNLIFVLQSVPPLIQSSTKTD